MYKNGIVSVLCIFALIISGCAGHNDQPSIEIDSLRSYKKEVSISKETISLSEAYTVKLKDGNAYYLAKDTDNKKASELLPMTRLMKYTQPDDNAEEVLSIDSWNVNAYYLSDFGGEERYTILLNDDESFSIIEYDASGAKTFETAFDHDSVFPEDFLSLGNNRYLVLFPKEFVLVDCEDKIKKSLCSVERFHKALLQKNGDIYISFVNKSGKNSIAKLDTEHMKLREETEISISGLLLCEKGENVVATDGKTILLLDTKDHSIEEIGDMSLNRISSDTVRAIESIENGFAIACCSGMEKVSLNLVKLTEILEEEKNRAQEDSIRYDAEGKQIVYMYCPEGKTILLDSIGGIIDCFNFENPEYSIEVIEPAENIDPIISADYHPDIVVEEFGSKIEEYSAGGYLEDLYPFIEKSDKISLDDIPDFLKESFEINGKLYALFRRFSLNAILISSANSTPIKMEPSEFVKWIADHNVLYTEGSFDRERLMMLCFMQTIDNYVDLEAGDANFCNSSFEEMLIALKECHMPEISSALLSDLDIFYGTYNGVTFLKQRIDGMKDIAQTEAALCENLSRVTFCNKSDSRNTCFYLPYDNVGIPINAKCKEGAFSFIEYLMTKNLNGMIMGVPTDEFAVSGACFTLNGVRDKCFNDAIGYVEVNVQNEQITYEITEKHKKLMEELIGEVKYLDDIHSRILSIMLEETEAYIQSDKSPEETANNIQNRVQLLITEKLN